MSGTRNKAAFRKGQRNRAILREILSSRNPLLPPMTLGDLQVLLARHGVFLARSSIAYHRGKIHEAEALKDCNGNYSSSNNEAA